MNTAVLTGRQVSQVMKVFIVTQAGKVADVTLQSSCHAEDESVIKVSVWWCFSFHSLFFFCGGYDSWIFHPSSPIPRVHEWVYLFPALSDMCGHHIRLRRENEIIGFHL